MTANLVSCYIKNSGLFKKLDKKVLERIAQRSLVHTLKRKRGTSEEFPLEGKVYIVHTGIAFLSFIDKNGKKIILDILSPGSIFGDLNFTSDKSSTHDSLFIEPFQEAGICEMAKTDFRKILNANPKFTLSLMSNLAKKLIALEEKIGTLFFSDVEARLIAQIASLGQKHGIESKTKIRLKLKVTHEKLAEMVGAARETVSETLSGMKKKGIIEIGSDNKFILNKAKITSFY